MCFERREQKPIFFASSVEKTNCKDFLNFVSFILRSRDLSFYEKGRAESSAKEQLYAGVTDTGGWKIKSEKNGFKGLRYPKTNEKFIYQKWKIFIASPL